LNSIDVFRQAQNRFSAEPLKNATDMKAYYVERHDEALAEMKESLLTEDNPLKILFTGHVGSGKSTELNKLVFDEDILRKFIVVPFSILTDYDPLNIRYQDILVAIGAEIYHQSRKIGIKLSKDFLEQLSRTQDTIIKTETDTVGIESTIEGKISAWFVSLVSKLKGEHTSKEEVRREITPKLNQLIEKNRYQGL
jgi:Ni2+-binding GTPase involved in maturation of urease and hydrogenase